MNSLWYLIARVNVAHRRALVFTFDLARPRVAFKDDFPIGCRNASHEQVLLSDDYTRQDDPVQ